MGLGYSIIARIDTRYSKAGIESILIKAKNIGYKFFLTDLSEVDPLSYKSASLEEAINAIFYGIPDPTINIISMAYDTTFIDLIMHGDEQITSIIFASFRYPWYRKENNQDTDDLDLIRYLRLMLDLIEDYKMIELHAEKD